MTGIKRKVKGLELNLTLDRGGLAQGWLLQNLLTVMVRVKAWLRFKRECKPSFLLPTMLASGLKEQVLQRKASGRRVGCQWCLVLF